MVDGSKIESLFLKSKADASYYHGHQFSLKTPNGQDDNCYSIYTSSHDYSYSYSSKNNQPNQIIHNSNISIIDGILCVEKVNRVIYERYLQTTDANYNHNHNYGRQENPIKPPVEVTNNELWARLRDGSTIELRYYRLG